MQRFGRYVLEERIAVGGMAEVFRARLDDNGFKKPVCIKRILPQLAGTRGFADMLRDEASLAARINHVNLVQALDFGSVDGTLFIAMELVDGANLLRCLRALRRNKQRVPVARALHVAINMCRGLHAAHTAVDDDDKPLHFVHRDISPQNVLLGKDGAIKVGDFGIARASERLSRTATGQIKGKPQYMAPEQALAESCDHRVDQFATAIVLWEALAGRELFRRPTVLATLDAVTDCDVPRIGRDDVGFTLEALLKKALSRDPAKRFVDMAAFESALDAELNVLRPTLADLDVRPLVTAARDNAEITQTMNEVTLEEQPAVTDPVDDLDVWRSNKTSPKSAPLSSSPTPAPSAAPSIDPQPLLDDEATRRLPPPAPSPQPRAPASALLRKRIAIAAASSAAMVAIVVVAALIHSSAPPPAVAPAWSATSTPALPPPAPPPSPPLAAPTPIEAHDVAHDDAPDSVASAEAPDDARPSSSSSSSSSKNPAHRSGPQADAIAHAKAALIGGQPERVVEMLAPFATSNDPDVHRLLGVANAKLKRNKTAAYHYTRYLALKPDALDADQVRKVLSDAR